MVTLASGEGRCSISLGLSALAFKLFSLDIYKVSECFSLIYEVCVKGY